MTALEALQELKFQVGNITYYTKDLKATPFQVRESGLFEIIEVALRENEILVGEITYLKNRYKSYLNALDLILKKNVFLPTVIFCQCVDYYNEYHSPELTQEEFDFLKEIIHGMYDSSK